MGNTYFCKELNKELPSVTTILNIIAKGEGFNNWLKKQGDKADKLLTDAGDFGTDIHNFLEAFGKGLPVNLSALKPKQLRCVNAFLEWKENNVKKFICTEQAVFNIDKEYAGTCDGVVELNDGRIALLDYKTSAYIYDTHELQVCAYIKAYDVKIDTGFILRFEKNEEKDKDLQVKEVKQIDYQYEVFLATLKLWNWKNNKKKEFEKNG
uniref:PD-(D/E)XK endonuclease-like domain-containing protein n=1 Tax=viral metagenome TaxID=1070528 RepID=A0A6H2A4H4_9ZZZZ